MAVSDGVDVLVDRGGGELGLGEVLDGLVGRGLAFHAAEVGQVGRAEEVRWFVVTDEGLSLRCVRGREARVFGFHCLSRLFCKG